MDTSGTPAIDALQHLLGRRGWVFFSSDKSIIARKHEWPAQLKVVIDPGGEDTAPVMALSLDLRSMPLRGERFRDIFNSVREDILRGLGSFQVRQMRDDTGWTDDVPDRVFLRGAGAGVSRHADVVMFDRCPEESGPDIVSRFAAESNRLVETGNDIAALLQRTYHRTVLRSDSPVSDLPETITAPAAVDAHPVVVGEPAYPWRR